MVNTDYCYVTSFSHQGYNNYGRRFIQSFGKYVQEELLVVLDQDFDVTSDSGDLNVITNSFKEKIKNTYDDFNTSEDYRFAPDRFCYKTSAICTALLASQKKYLVWLDADSIIKKNDLTKYLDTLAPQDNQIASFFDRDRTYGYSETGIIIFNLEHPGTKSFIEEWNNAFVNGEILNYSEWHDAFYFSHLVRSNPPGLFRFLCADLGLRTTHPIFELKSLRKRIEHLKGNTRKKLGFSPEKYWLPTFILRRFMTILGRLN